MTPTRIYHGVPSVRSGSYSDLLLEPFDRRELRTVYRQIRKAGARPGTARSALFAGILIGRASERNER